MPFPLTIRRLGFALATLVIACSGSAQTVSVEQLQADFANARVRRLVGMTVENRDGLKLATVRDFVVDFRTGRITYALLSNSGLLGLNPRLTLVPVRALSPATVKKRTLALDISKLRWGDAPRFRKKDLGALGERTREVQLYQFYGLPVPPRDSGAGGKGSFQFAGALSGGNVRDPQGRTLGRISGFLLDLTEHRPSLAIVTVENKGKKAGTYAVPLKAISPLGGGDVATDVNATLFREARLLTPQAWQSAASNANALYRYE
jgi:sporulation protein YlmC with PRC-barrel domain